MREKTKSGKSGKFKGKKVFDKNGLKHEWDSSDTMVGIG